LDRWWGDIAGPAVGFLAGMAGGLHRLSMNSFTMVPDCLATVAGGLLGGLLFWRFNDRRMSFVPSFLVGIAAGVINYLLILALAKPYILAFTFFEWTGLRSILAIGTGTGIFISIVNSVRSRVYSIGTSYAEKATEIAHKALPVIKGTLEAGVAEKLVQIIQESAIADAVAISDGQSVLAFAGEGSASHIVGGRDLALTGRFAAGGRKSSWPTPGARSGAPFRTARMMRLSSPLCSKSTSRCGFFICIRFATRYTRPTSSWLPA
jgi:two-component system sensor histidine kinase LytS